MDAKTMAELRQRIQASEEMKERMGVLEEALEALGSIGGRITSVTIAYKGLPEPHQPLDERPDGAGYVSKLRRVSAESLHIEEEEFGKVLTDIVEKALVDLHRTWCRQYEEM